MKRSKPLSEDLCVEPKKKKKTVPLENDVVDDTNQLLPNTTPIIDTDNHIDNVDGSDNSNHQPISSSIPTSFMSVFNWGIEWVNDLVFGSTPNHNTTQSNDTRNTLGNIESNVVDEEHMLANNMDPTTIASVTNELTNAVVEYNSDQGDNVIFDCYVHLDTRYIFHNTFKQANNIVRSQCSRALTQIRDTIGCDPRFYVNPKYTTEDFYVISSEELRLKIKERIDRILEQNDPFTLKYHFIWLNTGENVNMIFE